MHAVFPSSGIRIVNVKNKLFCCGWGYFDSSSGTCVNSTRGSDAPFPVDQGHVIFNRSSGSTSPNNTATVTSTVTLAGVTMKSATTRAITAAGTAASPLSASGREATVDIAVSTTATTAAGTAASPPLTHNQEATVGVAVGVPLGIALLGFVGMLWRQKKEAIGLRKEKKNWEEKYIALLSLLESKMETQRSQNVPHSSSETLTRYQLEDATIGELAI